ncbi:MAG TPA: glycerophosphodiester phosphodiesterase [Ideonella sp.]|uniref:glycerophosphodiester phosphodiesterase n=1 Tax=Ideonella sp. TaxID=1929293 RepID=UPI002CA704C6|nr:glycerophosphodiester phosphodiesterase [Ideonella sp.]HSI50928.1 glycerophosphodiester phosphodiesterase [Ideonella sp.]
MRHPADPASLPVFPRWIAHRGAGKLAPENTLAAFRDGLARGWRAFECDVKLSLDGTAFLLHDDTLERTSNGQGVAGEQPWAQLQALDAGSWHSTPFAGEPLPTLAQVAALLQAHGAWLDLEIKPSPGTDLATGRAVAAEAAELWAAHPGQLLLSSFEVPALEGAMQTAPQLPRGLLLDELRAGWADTARALGCCAVITHHRLMTPALVAQLHEAGWAAMVYTVNDAARASELFAAGLDSLVTDAVDRFDPKDRQSD